MKRIIGIFVMSGLMPFSFGQKSIDGLFAKYADNYGFVSLTVNGNLLNLLRSDKHDCEENHWPAKVSEIRILVQEDEDIKVDNFYKTVLKDINRRDYEEFMNVRESGQDFHMFVRRDGDIIKELLLVSGGEDNFIIQLKGKISVKEAENFCSEAREEQGMDLFSNLN